MPAAAREAVRGAEVVPNVPASAAAREADALSVLSALTSRAMDAAVGTAQGGVAGMAPSVAPAMNAAQAQAVTELEFEWGMAAAAHAATELEFEWGMAAAGGSLGGAAQLPLEASAAVEASAVLSMLTSRAMDAAVGTAQGGGAPAMNAAQAQAVTELEFEWGMAAAKKAATELEFEWGMAAPSPYAEPFEWTPSAGYRAEDAYGARGGAVEGAGRETEYEWRPSRQP